MMMVTEAKLTAGSKSFRDSAALNITYSTLPFCAVLSSAPPAMQQEAVPADVPFHAKSHTDHPVRTWGGLSLGHAKPPAARAAPAPAFPRAGDAAAHACKSQRQVTEREQGEDCSPGAEEKRERSAREGQRKPRRPIAGTAEAELRFLRRGNANGWFPARDAGIDAGTSLQRNKRVPWHRLALTW